MMIMIHEAVTYSNLMFFSQEQAVLDPKIEKRIAGIVLTSPAVGVQPSHPIFTVRTTISFPFSINIRSMYFVKSSRYLSN